MRTNKQHTADEHIGARIRAFRNALHLSQTDLGEKLGVTFQQIQKYEKGMNRISGSRLVELCDILQVRPEQILGNGTGIFVDRPDVFEALKDKDISAAFIALSKLMPSRRRAVMKALLALVAAFGGNGKQ